MKNKKVWHGMAGLREKRKKHLKLIGGIIALFVVFLTVSAIFNHAGIGATVAPIVMGLASFQRDPGTGEGGGDPAKEKEALVTEIKSMIEDVKKGQATAAELKSLEERFKLFEEKSNKPDKYDELLSEHAGLMAEMKAFKEKPASKEGTGIITQVKNFIKSLDLGKKVSEKKNMMDSLEIKAAALMTVENNIVSADGYSINVNNYVDPEIGKVPKPKNFILGLISVETQAGTEKIWWSERNTEEGNAQFIGEGDLKPLVSAKYETKSADIKEVAERWKMSNRMIMHTNRVVADFNEHANELIDQEIDTKVLLGDGTGDELLGISEQASAFIAPTALIGYYVNPNIWDVINAVITQIELANFTPTDVVLNTVERAKMFGIKDTQERYVMPPFMMPDGRQISGLNVTFTNKMPDGKILVGDLQKFKVVFSENVMYFTGWENDDFSKNLTSAKLEAFLGTYLKSPYVPAIVYDDIATVKTAIGTAI